MSAFKAAIIDDGAANCLFKNATNVSFDEDLNIQEDAFFTDETNHSSTCVNIIKKYSDISDVEWFNIKVINFEERGRIDCFLKALEYCRNKNVKLIHLSIGSRNFRDRKSIEKEIGLLLKSNTVIVASLSNENEYTSPACIDGVIGVKCSNDLRENEIFYLNNSLEKINFLASSRHIIRRGQTLEYCGLSNSYATPVVTAAVINILKDDNSLNVYEVINKLKYSSKKACNISMPKAFINGTEDMLEAPIILINLKDISVQKKLIKELKDRFLENGYNTFDDCNRFADQHEYFGNKLVNYLIYIEKFYKNDVIILGYTDSLFFSCFSSYDIIISDNKTDGLGNNDTKYIEYNNTNNIDIYSQIITLFEQGENK